VDSLPVIVVIGPLTLIALIVLFEWMYRRRR
jgi:hypothetical protein